MLNFYHYKTFFLKTLLSHKCASSSYLPRIRKIERHIQGAVAINQAITAEFRLKLKRRLRLS